MRNASRALSLNNIIPANITGSTVKVISASCQLSITSTAMIPTSVRISPRIVTTPAANIWFRTSTSLTTRVTSRPIGLRSKNLIGRVCRWLNICFLKSNIAP